MPELAVTGLKVAFHLPEGVVRAVRGVSFSVEAGRTLAIVGESGSGKSVAAQAILGLTHGARVSGRVEFGGRDLLTLRPRALRAVRGAQIAMIFQDPHSGLHPSFRVGSQIEEAIRVHAPAARATLRARAIELLDLVGIPDPARRADDYPHEFSGGMLQRAMIAMAIALNPRVLIADEPTTALDVTVQAQILTLLQRLQRELGMAMIFITHDLGVVSQIADDVAVMYAGLVMERGPRDAVLRRAHHPYTRGLLRSLPRGRERLTPIHGQPPPAIAPPPGCPFHPRCVHAELRCGDPQPFYEVEPNSAHESACWLPQERAE